MAVTVTDRRTTIDEADTTTDWTSTQSTSQSTTIFAESTASIAWIVSKTLDYLYHTHTTSLDCSGEGQLVYGWILNRGDPVDTATGGLGISLGDGTDLVAYHIAGSDKKGFTHDENNPYFQCLLLDTGSLPTNQTVWVGTDTLNYAALTQFGYHCDNGDAKAVGGVANYYADVIRVGNSGLYIEGGTTGDRGNFLEIATEDRSTATGNTYGIIRELSTDTYGLQGPLTFGNINGAADSYFDDSDALLAFEGRNITDNKYFLNVEGSASYTNLFKLDNCIIKSAGPAVRCDFSSDNIDILSILNTSFNNLGRQDTSITFSNNTIASGHVVSNCTFTACGQVDPGITQFTNNSFNSSTASGLGALLIDSDGVDDISDLSFTSGGDGHAIYVASTGSYTFSNFEYNGYGSNGTSHAAVYNDSGGSVTITVDGGDTPTVLNGTGASTTVIANTVTTKVTVKDLSDNSVIENARVLAYVTDGTNFPYQDPVTISGTIGNSYALVYHQAHGLSTDDNIIISNVTADDTYNGVYTITESGVNHYYYNLNEDATVQSASGVATFAFLNGLTNAQGEISDVRSVTTDQDITGWVRKASSSPYYVQGSITGTVDSATGLSVTVQLARDE